jgi:hypothetical protein
MKLPPKEHNHCGTENCCGSCETADLGPDWYLIAINPWYKFYHNHKTGEDRMIKLDKDSD